MTEQNGVHHASDVAGSCPLDDFNDLERDTLKEVGNISLGSSATVLSQLTSRRVNITTPALSYVTVQEINDRFTAPCILVEVEYVKGLIGSNLLIIDTRDAVIIGQLMMMEEPDPEIEMNEIHLSAVSEAMNMMMGAAATSMSDMFDRTIDISSPKVDHKQLNEAMGKEVIMQGDGGFIQVAFKVEVEGLIDSELLQLMPVDFARQSVDYLLDQVKGPSPLDDFDEMEQDTLKEVGNISLGSSATTLSQLTSKRVSITTPTLSYVTVDEINRRFKAPCILVDVEYIEGLIGSNLLIMDTKDAVIIGQLMMMEEPNSALEMNEIHLSAVSEAMNMMMGAAATSMSDMFQRMINISSPKVEYKKMDDLKKEKILKGDGGFIQVAFKVQVEDLIDSELLQLMPLDFARQAVDFLLKGAADEGIPASDPEVASIPEETLLHAGGGKAAVSFPRLDEKEGNIPGLEADELNLVKNISLEVKGVVGRIKMPLEKVLQLGKGSIVELDAHVGDEVEILINGKSVAAAEIVAIDNQYGLKLTKILKT